MADHKTFKCDSCGAYLEYNPAEARLTCPYCGKQHDISRIIDAAAAEESASTAQTEEDGTGYRGYHCRTCGAEVVVGATTAATRCYYCHSPVVLTDRLSEAFQPDWVIPFQLDRKEAFARFKNYLNKKRYVDRRFFSKGQLQAMQGVYYPYWMGTITGDARFEGQGKLIRHHTSGRYDIYETETYHLKRQGRYTFNRMFRKALQAVDRKLSDGIFPYRMKEAVPFHAGYLSGFLAEKRDVEGEAVVTDMVAEATRLGEQMVRNYNGKYQSVRGQGSFTVKGHQLEYLLLPVWILTYRGKHPKRPFYFMMNGQTGSVCGKLPIDWGRLLPVAAGVAALVTAALLIGGKLLW